MRWGDLLACVPAIEAMRPFSRLRDDVNATIRSGWREVPDEGVISEFYVCGRPSPHFARLSPALSVMPVLVTGIHVGPSPISFRIG